MMAEDGVGNLNLGGIAVKHATSAPWVGERATPDSLGGSVYPIPL